MTAVDQYDTTQPIPFEIRVNSGNYPGDDAANPTISLSKSGGMPVPAIGSIKPVGGGLYWFWPAVGDVDTIGAVVMLISVPSSDIVARAEYIVRKPSLWKQFASVPQNLATAVSLLQRLVTAQRA